MDKAREAVNKVTGDRGHHTHVDEEVRPAVTKETIKPTRQEEITHAKDKEVHQDHYHTTVQPLTDREVLPEKHHHQIAQPEEREFHHRNHDEERRRLEQEQAHFRDTQQVEGTTHTRGQAQEAVGHHTHHHVHEQVQPVIEKETIQPEVVHKVKPVHEVHHSDSQFHGQSVLPPKSLSEVKDIPEGQRTGVEEYEGVPRKYDEKLQVNQTEADRFRDRTGVDGPQSHHTGGTGLADNQEFVEDRHRVKPPGTTSGAGAGTSGQGYEQGRGGQGFSQGGSTTGQGYDQGRDFNQGSTGHTTTGTHTGHQGAGLDQGSATSRTGGVDDTSSSGTTGKKPSLLDRINPLKDTDGDGKKGIMD